MAKASLGKFAQSLLTTRAPGQASHSRALHLAAKPCLHAKYQPPLPMSCFSDLTISEDHGRHEMYIGSHNGTPHYIKRISPTPDEIWLNIREDGMSTPFETLLQQTERKRLFAAEREVFITRLLRLLVGDHTRKEIFVAASAPMVIDAVTDTGPKKIHYPLYYVAGSAMPSFESLASFPNVHTLFTADNAGRTIFNHPEKGPQLITGRILVKAALSLLGEKDDNIANLALGDVAPDGRRRVITIDHEGCSLYHDRPQAIIDGLRSDQHITSIFPALNLSNLGISQRKAVKEQAVLHFDRIFNSEEGKNQVKSLIISTFSPGSSHLVKNEIYEPLTRISTIVRAVASEIDATNLSKPPSHAASIHPQGTGFSRASGR